MRITDIVNQMKSKNTWSRVIELQRYGYYKDKEKRILFGAPIPPEDVLPLRISIALSMALVVLVLLVAASFYFHLSIIIRSTFIILLFILMVLPHLIKSFLK